MAVQCSTPSSIPVHSDVWFLTLAAIMCDADYMGTIDLYITMWVNRVVFASVFYSVSQNFQRFGRSLQMTPTLHLYIFIVHVRMQMHVSEQCMQCTCMDPTADCGLPCLIYGQHYPLPAILPGHVCTDKRHSPCQGTGNRPSKALYYTNSSFLTGCTSPLKSKDNRSQSFQPLACT